MNEATVPHSEMPNIRIPARSRICLLSYMHSLSNPYIVAGVHSINKGTFLTFNMSERALIKHIRLLQSSRHV